jgi:hypothetical protein
MVPEIEARSMKITWLAHSGFLVEGKEATLVFDWFQDPADAVEEFFRLRRASALPPVPVYFFVSHAHADHCSPRILRYAGEPGVAYVLEEDAARSLLREEGTGSRPVADQVLRMRPGQTATAGPLGIRTFGSTDQGVSFLVEVDGHRVFHAGDLNDWYWENESTEAELAADEAAYDRIVSDVAATMKTVEPSFLAVAMLPLDPRLGRHADRGILRFLDAVSTRNVVPMHLPEKTGLPGLLARALAGRAKVIAFDGPGESNGIQIP